MKSIDLGDESDHEPYEDTDLIDDCFPFVQGDVLEVVVEAAIDGLKEPSEGMFLEHVSPL